MHAIKSGLLISFFFSASLVQATTYNWSNGGGDNAFTNGLNWDTPGSAALTSSDTAFIDLDGADAALFTSGMNHTIQRFYIGQASGTSGEMNISGGTLNCTLGGGTARNRLGRNGGTAVLNQSGGTLDMAGFMQIGFSSGTDGTYNLSGGAVIMDGLENSGNELYESLEIGNGGSGLLNITGGSLQTKGHVDIQSGGTFQVSGSGATAIEVGGSGTSIDGKWTQASGGVLDARIGTNGITTIFVRDNSNGLGSGDVVFEAGALLDVDFLGAITNEGTFTLMEWEGSVTDHGLAFTSGVDPTIWSFNVDAAGKKLTVTAGDEPVGTHAVTVSSIAELKTYAALDNYDITMTPGTYWLTGPGGGTASSEDDAVFLDLSGANSTFTFTGVHIKVDTQELKGYGGSYSVNVLRISGYGVEVDGLTLSMENVSYKGTDQYGDTIEWFADRSGRLVQVIGSNTTVKNCEFTSRGSYPYGYGDAFGKGSRPTDDDGNTNAAYIQGRKMSGFLITYGATDVVVDNVTLNMRSYGHGFVMQFGASDILFQNCNVIGDTLADSDDIIAHPEYQKWGTATYRVPIPEDIRISKHEGAFRTYTNDGLQIENVVVTNCVVERMRNAIAFSEVEGTVRVYDTESIECEMGFMPSMNATENTFVRCRGDALHGPLIYFARSADNVRMEVELTGSGSQQGDWPIGLIGGDGNRITLTTTAGPDVYPGDAYINLSQKWREWRHTPQYDIDESYSLNYSDYAFGNFITNLTDQIVVFGKNATDNTDCVSDGGVINKGSGNTYTGTTRVPAPILVQDTWTTPPNPTNVVWARYDEDTGELTFPTLPYPVFSGIQLVDETETLGGSQSGDGGTVVGDGGTLEFSPGIQIQDETVVLSGTGTDGQGALYSEGLVANTTRLNNSSGEIMLAGDASIGVGTAGNQFVIGGISGNGNLTKIGPGMLYMSGGANSFAGSLTVAEGEVLGRSNKAVSDLTVAANTVFSQYSTLALNQGSDDEMVLHGTLDLNKRGFSDGSVHSADVGSLIGGAAGLITSTSTGAVQTVNINSSTADSEFFGSIQGRVKLVKNGAGTTLTLNGACTHTEGTFVNAGWLGGTGSISGAVTLADGGGIAPGNSVGVLTTGPQTWNGGALLEVEMTDTAGAAGTGWDLLVVNGAITFDSSMTSGNPFLIVLSSPVLDFAPSQSASWLIVDASSINGGFASDKFLVDTSAFAADNPLDGGTFSVSESGGDLYLDFTPMPYTTLEEWRYIHFGVYTNSGSAADDANPDGDGRNNLFEYGTGTDPNVYNSNALVTVGTTLEESSLTITFDRIDDPDLVYWVEVNTNLLMGGWDPIWSSTGSSNIAGSVTVEDAEEISNHWNRFLRLLINY